MTCRASDVDDAAKPMLGRRQVLGSIACVAIGAVAGDTVCGCCAAFAASPGGGAEVPPAKGYLVQEVRDSLYWVSDGSYSTMFMVASEGVIACDAPPTLGPNYLKAVAEITDKPITHVVYSHEHVDHIAAAHLFPKNAIIVAHRLTADALARRNDPRRPRPTVTFDDAYSLRVGNQLLELSYKGINHSVDNIFIYAPRQRTLMFIDVIYPGWMPYKNLGVAVDVPGFVRAHQQVLSYDFDTLVAGHVARAGTRADVEVQIDLIRDLAAAAERAYQALTFPAYLKERALRSSGKSSWDLHNDYEQAMVDRMFTELLPKWRERLTGTETYLRDNCWAMLETYVVQGTPDLKDL